MQISRSIKINNNSCLKISNPIKNFPQFKPPVNKKCPKFWSSSKLAVARCQIEEQYQNNNHKSQIQLEQNQKNQNFDEIPNYLMYVSGFQIFLSAVSSPALAQETSEGIFTPGFSKESYYVTLGLFVLSLPGLWSLIKRAPKAKIVRKTFEVEGPKKEGPTGLDRRARQIFAYFKNYNYKVKETGDVIVFEGTYAASRGQAAALVFYVFIGLGSTALVLSIALPQIGNWWYLLTLLSPLAGLYYFQRGTREEEIRVKMITSDDETTTDIVIQGDDEEIDRFRRELQLMEKGKVYVKGVLESS
eukprot:TRINITY_DN3145_c1_g1_i3.p1 TRINITY_DN3145_c1_g1~~TRINITY_DN3145_c1_g1_i3.p1  ORF type:complete len:302 (-),score=50.38 TRINITY_DN3145_c1_g1_i3:182-1087(-)